MKIEIINNNVFKIDGVITNASIFSEEEFKQKFGKSKKDFFQKKTVNVKESKKKSLPIKRKDTQKKTKKTS